MAWFLNTVSAILAAFAVYIICLVLVNSFEESDFNSFSKSEKIAQFCKKYRIIR